MLPSHWPSVSPFLAGKTAVSIPKQLIYHFILTWMLLHFFVLSWHISSMWGYTARNVILWIIVYKYWGRYWGLFQVYLSVMHILAKFKYLFISKIGKPLKFAFSLFNLGFLPTFSYSFSWVALCIFGMMFRISTAYFLNQDIFRP